MLDRVSAAWQAFRDAHLQADTDNEPNSLHHTIGNGPFQAAPGNHSHSNYVSLDTIVFRADYTGATQSIPYGSWTKVTEWLVDRNSDSVNDFVYDSVNKQVTVKRAGWYASWLKAAFVTGGTSTNSRGIRLWDVTNSLELFGSLQPASSSNSSGPAIYDEIYLAADTVVQVEAFQAASSPNALNLNDITFGLRRVGDG